MECVGDRNNQQHYQNYVNDALLTGDSSTLVLGLIVPPELHLLIGKLSFHYYFYYIITN